MEAPGHITELLWLEADEIPAILAGTNKRRIAHSPVSLRLFPTTRTYFRHQRESNAMLRRLIFKSRIMEFL